MQPSSPSHVLLVEAMRQSHGAARWHFFLHDVAGAESTSAADIEPNCSANRAATLALVRGLEAIDSAGKVTLLTDNTYIKRALTGGLAQWRESGWRWERFGRPTPIRDADLWQRVDHALQYHRVQCHAWQSLRDTDSLLAAESSDNAWVPFAADVPSDAPIQQQPFAAPDVAAYQPDPAVIVVRRPQSRYKKLRQAAKSAVQNVGDKFSNLLDNPLAQAS